MLIAMGIPPLRRLAGWHEDRERETLAPLYTITRTLALPHQPAPASTHTRTRTQECNPSPRRACCPSATDREALVAHFLPCAGWWIYEELG
jgi:hypothetical protein